VETKEDSAQLAPINAIKGGISEDMEVESDCAMELPLPSEVVDEWFRHVRKMRREEYTKDQRGWCQCFKELFTRPTKVRTVFILPSADPY
jgi:hypothetical protein